MIAAPALIKLGVPDFAAHMFIFYYAVLSEVSPPTALSPFAAAAITGGDPYKTTLQCWKYTVPAFLRAVHVRARPGRPGPAADGLDQGARPAPNWWSIAQVTLTAALGIAALAGGFQGWALRSDERCIERCDADRRRRRARLPGRHRRRWSASSLVVAVLAMQRFLAARRRAVQALAERPPSAPAAR